jgi:hypothetical protein
MSVLRNLKATDEEAALAAANAEVEELSDHSRPMLMNEINEA